MVQKSPAIAHHQRTDAQPFPEKWHTSYTSSSSSFCSGAQCHMVGVSPCSAGVSYSRYFPSQLLPQPTHWLGNWEAEKTLTLWKCCLFVCLTKCPSKDCAFHLTPSSRVSGLTLFPEPLSTCCSCTIVNGFNGSLNFIQRLCWQGLASVESEHWNICVLLTESTSQTD